jgi:hypothetical protein
MHAGWQMIGPCCGCTHLSWQFMKTIPMRVLAPLFAFLTSGVLCAQEHPATGILPDATGPWHAIAATATYDTKSIFDYLDGGAEIYLAYGMTAAYGRRYECPGRPAIEASVFFMHKPAGAFGIFTYERMDAEAGIGQGSEYGGGILRFWQGHTFVFLQAESETPNTRAALLTLGRQIVSRLGPPAPKPKLASVLPARERRALTLRFTLTPTVLQNIEPTLAGNPLDFPAATPAVLGRYGRPQDKARILVIELPDSLAATHCAAAFRERFIGITAGGRPDAQLARGKSVAQGVGRFLVLILDMPRAAVAHRHLQEITTSLRRIAP